MGRHFDDYPGFQPKTTPAQRYATQRTKLHRHYVIIDNIGGTKNQPIFQSAPFILTLLTQKRKQWMQVC